MEGIEAMWPLYMQCTMSLSWICALGGGYRGCVAIVSTTSPLYMMTICPIILNVGQNLSRALHTRVFMLVDLVGYNWEN